MLIHRFNTHTLVIPKDKPMNLSITTVIITDKHNKMSKPHAGLYE